MVTYIEELRSIEIDEMIIEINKELESDKANTDDDWAMKYKGQMMRLKCDMIILKHNYQLGQPTKGIYSARNK